MVRRISRGRTGGFSERGRIRTGGFVTSSSKTNIQKTGQKRKAGAQIVKAERIRQVASSIRPKIRVAQQPRLVKAPPPRISSQQRKVTITNPLSSLINAIETTSLRNAQRKEQLRQQRLRGERSEAFSIDEIFGGFL